MEKHSDRYGLIYYASLIASIGSLLVGYTTVIISGALIFINNTFRFSVEQQEILVSTALCVAIIGALLAGPMCYKFGRRFTILTAAVIFMLASILSLFSRNYQVLFMTRALTGLGVGMASMAVPFYISEIVPANIRGSCVCLTTLVFYLGACLAYIVDRAFASNMQWQYVLASAFIPALGLFIGMYHMPETPHWLVAHDRKEDGKKVLSRMRYALDAEEEIEAINDSSEFKEKKSLLKRGVVRAFFIGSLVAIFMEVTGADAVFYYMPTILKSAGFWEQKAAISASIAMGVVSFITAGVAIVLIDWIGRRKLLLVGTFLMTLGLIMIGIVFKYYSYYENHHVYLMLSFLLYALGYVLGLGSVGWLLISEIYPLKIKSFSIAFTITIKWIANYLIARFFLTQILHYGRHHTFWVYASLSVICFFFIYFFVPETKGKSLESIEEYWLKDKKHGTQID